MTVLLWTVVIIMGIGLLSYHFASLAVRTVALTLALLFVSKFSGLSGVSLSLWWSALIVFAVLFNTRSIRRTIISNRLFVLFKKIMPSISQTEKEARETFRNGHLRILRPSVFRGRTLLPLPCSID